MESPWDYPRPPRVEDCSKRIRVVFQGIIISHTQKAKRVLETSHPPVYYIPPEDIRSEYLRTSNHHTYCEWKGAASYYTVEVNGRITENAAWYYPDPAPEFESIRNYAAFYASKMDACYVDDELVIPQKGSFYGGWITKDIRI